MPTATGKRSKGARLKSSPFDSLLADIAPRMRPEEAHVEASRCLYCYDAPCIQACPTHIDIPLFIRQIAANNLSGSSKTILEANALGHSCARVCPVEVLCEGSCVFLDWHEKPIQIARLQRHATDHYVYDGEDGLFEPGKDNGKPVAVIGAGPAGLSAAFYLRRLGHPVTLFEKRALGGGLNSFGIAEYKMTQRSALDEVERILALGVDLRGGREVGKDVPFSDLARFAAVFVGIGLGPTRRLGVPGEDLPGVIDALRFIEKIKNRDKSALAPGETTIVIGAGNTAIDAVTQAKRLGTPRVLMAYRRGQRDMSAYPYEFDLAKGDEAEFLWHCSPKRILGNGRVSGVEFIRTRLVKGELSELSGTEFTVPCDRLILAIGQRKHAHPLAAAAKLKLQADGRIEADPATMRTSNPRFWAGGDAINGGKEVVNAAADGKRAAWSIHRALTGAEAPPPGNEYWVSTIDGRKVAPIPSRHAR